MTPTVVKLTRAPNEEEALPWTLTVSANVLSMAALDWSSPGEIIYVHLLPPLYFVVMNGLILALIATPRRKRC